MSHRNRYLLPNPSNTQCLGGVEESFSHRTLPLFKNMCFCYLNQTTRCRYVH